MSNPAAEVPEKRARYAEEDVTAKRRRKRQARAARRREQREQRKEAPFGGQKWKEFVPDLVVVTDSAARARVEKFLEREFPAGSPAEARVIESEQEHRLVFVSTPRPRDVVWRLWTHPQTWTRVVSTFPVDGRCRLADAHERLAELEVPAGARVRLHTHPRSLIEELGKPLEARGVQFALRDYTHVLFLCQAYKKVSWALRPAEWYTVRSTLGEPTNQACRDRVLVRQSPVAGLLMPGREGPAPAVPANSTAPAQSGGALSKVCRAYWKINEAFFDAELAAWLCAFEAGGRVARAVDVGASPGGWSWFMASHGVDVVAVDPGDMGFACDKFEAGEAAAASAAPVRGRVRHAQALIQDVYGALRAGGPVDLVVCDMNEPPSQAAGRLIELAHQGVIAAGSRLVLTAKLFKTADRQAQEAADLLEPYCEARPRISHLFHNTRHERTLVAVIGSPERVASARVAREAALAAEAAAAAEKAEAAAEKAAAAEKEVK